jgi:hypothetical protein
MHKIIRIVLYCAIIMLVSCTRYYDAVFPTKEMTACKISCREAKLHCNKVCYDNCTQCRRGADARAIRHYDLYKHQQRTQGEIIALELKSYRDPLQCRKTTCDCSADYQVCIQSCAGKIRKRLQVVKACVPNC